MNRLLTFLTIFVFFYSCPSLFAQNPPPSQPPAAVSSDKAQKPKNPFHKLKRGIVNVVTAPIEIAKGVDDGWKQNSCRASTACTGAFTGFFKGIAHTVGRMGSGVWDIVSFPFKVPANYEPLMKPEFIMDNK